MKRTSKSVFFIVLVLILALAYTSFFGIYTQFGDRTDTVIRGAKDIRWGIDIRGGVDVTYGPVDESVPVTEANLQGIETIIAERLIGKGITDYEMYSDVTNHQVIVRFPWSSSETDFDPAAAIEELGQTAMLEFRLGDETETDKDGNTVPKGKVVLTGSQVVSAQALFMSESNGTQSPVVQLTLNESGKAAFAEATKIQSSTATKGTISIWLDGIMISNPTVQETITEGVATITSDGFTSLADAADLANLINSGSLPFAIEAKSSGTVSPTMGEKALEAMLLAGVIAFVLIAVFMILYYRLPGLVAVIALVGQMAGSIAAISGYFGVLDSFTLTLPGIAGIVLSIGIGVDANVITAERVKEEIRAGKTIDNAIRLGSKNSFWSIFDGNISVVIVAVVLMGVFGPADGIWSTLLKPLLFWAPASTTGSVYSFGYTLFIGVIFNFVMGVWASRAMLRSVSRFKFLRKPWLYGGVKE